jgi:hypothetical protein
VNGTPGGGIGWGFILGRAKENFEILVSIAIGREISKLL